MRASIRALIILLILLLMSGCAATATPTTVAELPTATVAPIVEPTAVPDIQLPTVTAITPPTEAPPSANALTGANAAQLGQALSIHVADAPVVVGALSPTAHQGATLDADRFVRIWDTDTGALLHEMGPLDGLGFGLAYSPDGTKLVFAGGFETKIWDAASGAELGSIKLQIIASWLHWSPDSKEVTILGDSSSTIDILDANTVQVIDHFVIPSRNVLWAVTYSADGSMLAVSDYLGNAIIYSRPDHQIIKELPTDKTYPWDLEFSPDGKLFVSCNQSGRLFAWETATWATYAPLTINDAHGHLIGCSDGFFSKDGTAYFSAGLDGHLIAWDAATGTKLADHDLGDAIWTASPSGDGSEVALAMDNGTFEILAANGAGIPAPPQVEAPPKIIEIEDVPLYPGILETVAYDALDVPRKCGGIVFRHFDIYYRVDYGGDLPKEVRLTHALNQQIMDFYKQAFEAQDWIGFDVIPPEFAQINTVFWEEESRAYPPAEDDPPYVGSCYLATVLIQPPGADLEVIADVK